MQVPEIHLPRMGSQLGAEPNTSPRGRMREKGADAWEPEAGNGMDLSQASGPALSCWLSNGLVQLSSLGRGAKR